MAESSELTSLQISFNNENHRVSFDVPVSQALATYDELVATTLRVVPHLEYQTEMQLSWVDEENDTVVIGSDEEMFEAFRVMSELDGSFRFTVTAKSLETAINKESDEKSPVQKCIDLQSESGAASNQEEEKVMVQETSSTSTPFTERHTNIRCDGCGEKPIIGIRYHCTVRADFDLCGACEAKNPQPHRMEKIFSHNANVFDHLQIGLSNSLGWLRGTSPTNATSAAPKTQGGGWLRWKSAAKKREEEEEAARVEEAMLDFWSRAMQEERELEERQEERQLLEREDMLRESMIV